MEKDVEHIYIDFHNQARNIFYGHYTDFSHATERLNRNNEEARYLRERNAYVHSLQARLLQLAQRTVETNPACTQTASLSQNLNHFIADYLHQFCLKVGGL